MFNIHSVSHTEYSENETDLNLPRLLYFNKSTQSGYPQYTIGSLNTQNNSELHFL